MGEAVRLWTIQTPRMWSQLSEHGFVTGDGRRSDPFFRPAYTWLREQMKIRTSEYTERHLLWFWTHRPDLRHRLHRNYGRPKDQVVLECLVPQERVLLSDYEGWHAVLNNWYLPLTEEEREARYAREDARKVPPHVLECEKRRSWERIFDLPTLHASYEPYTSPPLVQATVERLYIQEVAQVRHIRVPSKKTDR